MDKIYLSPFLTLTAKNFAIKDHHHENMIFATTLKGRINFPRTGKQQVCLSFATLDKGEVVLRKYAGEERVNIAVWAEGLKRKEKKEPKFKLLFENIALNDVRFVYINDDKRQYKDDNTIDYAFFELQHIFLDVDNFLVFGPDISCKINALSLSQYTGFEILSFIGNFRIYTQGLLVDDLCFTTPNSTFKGNFAFRYEDWSDYTDFVNRILFDTEVKCASIALRDIVYFAPQLQGMDDQFIFSGHVKGPVNHLATKDVFLKYKLQTRVAGNFAIKNMLDFNNGIFDIELKEAFILFSELSQFKLPKGETITLPDITKNINYSKITGKYCGSLTKFNTNLSVQTNLGSLSAVVKTTPLCNKFSYLGTVSCNGLDIGKLLNQPKYFNKINGSTRFEAEARKTLSFKELLNTITVRANGELSAIDFCGYTHRNIPFSGTYAPKRIALSIQNNDSLTSFKASGTICFEKELPTLAASLVHVDVKLAQLFSFYPQRVNSNSVGFEKLIHKIQQMPDLCFTMDSISIAMSGDTFENLNGFVGIDNAKLTDATKTSRIDWVRFTAINKPNLPHQYQLHTNAFNASVKTNYNYNDLVTVLTNAAYFYLPKMFNKSDYFATNKEIISEDSTKFVDIDLKLFYTRNLFTVLLPKLEITRDAFVNIHLGNKRNEDHFNFMFPRVSYTTLGKVNNLKASGKLNDNNSLEIQLLCDSLTLYQKNGNLTFYNIEIDTESNKDEIQFMSSWYNPSKISVNKQNIFQGVLKESDANDFLLSINDTKLFLRESLWQFTGNGNTICFGSNRLLFNQCVLSSDVGRISVHGEVSKELDKECHILLDNFDISLVNSLISKSDMEFGGNMSLRAQISPNLDKFNIESNAFVKNFVFNEELLGDLFLEAQMMQNGEPHFKGGVLSVNDRLNIDLATFSIQDYLSLPNRIIELEGQYLLNKKELQVHADMDTLKIGFLSPFLASFSNLVEGFASGSLDFVMNKDSLYFDGKVRIKNAQMGIAPLNTIYQIKDQDIYFNREGIDFKRIVIKDKFNNEAILSGYVYHSKFKDFKIDLNISTSRIMALNTPRKIDDPFFGDGFVSGDISIQGDTKQLNFTSRNIRTLSGSMITFPLNSATSVSSAQGIYFVHSKDMKEKTMNTAKSTSTLLNFDFLFDITRDADVRLELDPIDGVLKCKTNGRVQLTYNTNSGTMNLGGILAIVSGTFNMSLRNFFPRNFTIVEGGTISFAGPLTSTQINVSALYQRASTLRSLNPELSKIGRTDVYAYLGLTGNLMNPNPAFTFAFPRLTNEEQFQVFAALDTVNHQNGIRQFFSFVFLNTFITAESNMSTTQQSMGTGIDMVSGILSSFISNQFDNFSFGVNYINNQDNYTEYSVNAEMHLLNDRLRLRTNLGYGANRNLNTHNNSFVGDVDLGAWLNENKNWLL
ncbi:MAG: translocation/assembly module TamB, partial [Firmicutes bacterium]|nr:translocation/assembly module TamB [Bacillota bacterium]